MRLPQQMYDERLVTPMRNELTRLGVHWSGPTGEPFFRALVDGVLEALVTHTELEGLARRLSQQWNG